MVDFLLIATYTAPYKRMTLTFNADDSVDYVLCGDVSDADLQAALDAGGGDVPGYTVSIAL